MTEGLLVGLGVLITAVAQGLYKLLTGWHQSRMARTKSTIEEYQAICQRLEAAIVRCEKQIEEQQRAISGLAQEHSECQVELADLYGLLVRTHDIARRLARKAPDPEDVPELPPRKSRREVAFVAKTTEQNTLLVEALNQKATGGGPPS